MRARDRVFGAERQERRSRIGERGAGRFAQALVVAVEPVVDRAAAAASDRRRRRRAPAALRSSAARRWRRAAARPRGVRRPARRAGVRRAAATRRARPSRTAAACAGERLISKLSGASPRSTVASRISIRPSLIGPIVRDGHHVGCGDSLVQRARALRSGCCALATGASAIPSSSEGGDSGSQRHGARQYRLDAPSGRLRLSQMVTVVIPPPYRGPTQGADRVDVAGATVHACIEAVEARHPGFGPMILDASGRVHRFVKLFRNGDQLQGDVLGTRDRRRRPVRGDRRDRGRLSGIARRPDGSRRSPLARYAGRDEVGALVGGGRVAAWALRVGWLLASRSCIARVLLHWRFETWRKVWPTR